MQFLKIKPGLKLQELSDLVGERNTEYVLNANQLSRTPEIGKAFSDVCDTKTSESKNVEWNRKSSILNSFVSDSDVFETAALLRDSDWKLLSNLGTFPNMLRIPDSIVLPDTVDILGNGEGVKKSIYKKAMNQLSTPPHSIDPAIFNEYSVQKPSRILDYTSNSNSNVFQYFRIPWGDVTLYSSLDNSKIDFPVYPEEIQDQVKANYTTMPDMLYQYEPWQIYQSSGPRSNTYTFSFHRDMWTGDHRDGKANELIRFCEACCYPEYNGSAVNTSTVTLLVAGRPLIVGIMNDVSTRWDGPIGLDGWYLHCELQISITEVSTTPLNYSVVKQKPLIG